MTTFLLALMYPVLLAAKLANVLSGRDPLLRNRRDAASYWVERPAAPSDAGYFLEASPVEAQKSVSAARLPEAMLVWLSRWYTPPRSTPNEKFSPATDREQGIPDEMYTLW